MAKFAVLFFAALAFQVVFAGVRRHYNLYDDVQVGYQTGKLDNYVGQIQSVTNDLSVSLQSVLPNNRQVAKTLIWQCRELAQVVDQIISRLQAETNNYSGDADQIIQQVLGEFRAIQSSLQQTVGYTDVSNVGLLKNQLNTNVQSVADQIEKLVYLVQGDLPVSQGSLYTTIKSILDDYLTTIQNIQFQVQSVGQDIPGAQSPSRLQIQGGYDGGLVDQTALGLYGKKVGYEGLLQGGKYGGLYGQSGLNGKSGLYGQTGLATGGLWKGGKYGDVGSLGLLGKGGSKYAQSVKGLAIQIQAVASDLTAALQNVNVDNVVVKQTLVSLVREYIQNLEIIVERLEQVGLTTGVITVGPQQIVLNLKQVIVSLRQVIGSGVTVNARELINQLCLYVQNIVNDLERLTQGVQTDLEFTKSTSVVRDVLVQFLTVTRNLCIQVQNISQIGQPGQTTSGFGIQIQTLANGLTSTLETVSIDNKQDRLILVSQCRELAQYLETIIERLQTVSYKSVYGTNLPQQIAINLRQIIVGLQQVGGLEDIASVQNLKLRLITCIQDTATEIQKLLWVGQGDILNTGLSGILNDFVALLQNQQIQLQGISQFSQYGQGPQHLAIQIQAITNNLAIFLQNVPSNGEQFRQQLEIQARKLVQNIESIIQRLEIEVINTNEIGAIQQVIFRLRQIVSILEKVTVYGTSNSVYELNLQFNVVLQNVASELRKLAYLVQYDTQYVQGNLNGVIRSVLIQYLNVIQYVQVQLQGINQTVQIGQTPRELALQIEVVARRLSGMLRVVVPDNKQTQNSIIYQARRLCQIIAIIVNKLQAEITTGKGLPIIQQVAINLNQIQLYLQQVITQVDVVSTYQLKIQLAARIQDAAIEIQKLIYAAQSDVQQGVYGLIRGVLIDFLGGLQNLQMQIQDNLQIVLNGQSPRTLVIQIQSVASRLTSLLQYVQPTNSQQLRQTLIIQIGELTQTIENVVQLLQTEIKNSGENSVILKQVVAKLNKISLSLQKIAGAESIIPINELCIQLNLNVQNIVEVIQRLAYIAEYKLQEIQVGTYQNGVLNGAFNNILATLRNILIQLQNTRTIGQYGLNIQELSTQIQSVTNHLGQSLQLVGASTKQVKQALAIQALRYAIRIQTIVDRLETEVSYNSEINVVVLKEIVQNLRHVVVTLQQIGGSLTTSTITDLRTQLNTQVQNVAAQIQKLLVVQTNLQQTQGYVDTIVRSVLIEYLAAVQNLYIRIQNIAQISQKGQNLYQLAIQIDTVVSDLSSYLQYVLIPGNKLVGQTIIVETRQLVEVIDNIVNKLQTVSGIEINGLVQQVLGQLKQAQLSLQQIVGGQTIGDIRQLVIQLEVNVQRAAVAIQELVWAVQSQLEQVQVNTAIVTLVREVLLDYLTVVQNVYIQIYNAIPISQIRQSSWGVGLQGLGGIQGAELQGLGNQGQWGVGLKGLGDYQGLQGLGGFQGQWGVGQDLGDYQSKWGAGLKGQWSEGLGDYHGIKGLGRYQGQWGVGSKGLGDYQSQWGVGLRGLDFGKQGLRLDRSVVGLGRVGQITDPQQYLIQIRNVVSRLSVILQSSGLNGQEVKQIITVQVGQLGQIIEGIIDQLQQGINTDSGKVDSVLQQVIIRLREVQQSLRQLVGYTTFTSVVQLRTELDNCIQIVVSQIEKLVYILEQVPQGNLYVVIRSVLVDFLNGIQHILWQIQGLSQIGNSVLYGMGYRYGDLYNQYSSVDQLDNGLYRSGDLYGKSGLGQYGKGYGYGGLYDNQLGGLYNRYGNVDQLDLGLQGSLNYQGLTCKQLINQIQTIANQIAQEIQTVSVSDKQFKQILIVQARQLMQVIDNIIDRLQAELTGELGYTTVQKLIRSLRQIQVELQQIVSAGVLTTVYQIRAQYSTCIQNIALELNQLGLIVKSDVKVQGGINVIIRNVLIQYLVYLRNLQYQWQGNSLGLQGAQGLQSLDVSLGYDVPLVYGRLGNYVRGGDLDLNVDDNVQGWIGVQPQSVGSYEDSYIRPVGILDGAWDVTRTYRDSIRGY